MQLEFVADETVGPSGGPCLPHPAGVVEHGLTLNSKCSLNRSARSRASGPTPIHPSSGRKDKLMRVTTASQERFSSCGYTRSKQ